MGQDRARQTGYTVSADRPFTGGDDKAVVHWTDLGTERTHSVGPYHHDLVVAGNRTNTGTVADPQEDLVRSSRASAHS